MVVGVVKVKTHRCKSCKKGWRTFEMTVDFSVGLAEKEVKRLYAARTDIGKYAARYLESRISATSVKSLEQKRLDAWEKKFLKSALGDDYDG